MKKFIHLHLWLIPFVSLNKYFELSFQILTEMCEWFTLSIVYREKQDHPGLYFIFSFLKLFYIEFSIYDNRHWDAEKNCFMNTAVQYSNACSMQNCRFNLLNLEFDLDSAKDCLEDTKSLQEFLKQIEASYVRDDFEFVHPRLAEHFEEIENGIKELRKWLEKLTK